MPKPVASVVDLPEPTPAPRTPLPNVVNLNVPFFPQAPDGDWSLPWKEACEESSVIQALYFVKNKPLDRDTFRSEILKLVDFQTSTLGYFEDTNVRETATMVTDFYGWPHVKIINNPTIEALKRELAAGNPIIAPFAGRMLKNPFFSNEGPYYHMGVIVGYDQPNETFFVNDVGTKRGKDFAYRYETIMNAMHDWNAGDIYEGKKAVLVIQAN